MLWLVLFYESHINVIAAVDVSLFSDDYPLRNAAIDLRCGLVTSTDAGWLFLIGRELMDTTCSCIHGRLGSMVPGYFCRAWPSIAGCCVRIVVDYDLPFCLHLY